MAYIPATNSVVAFQSDPTKLVGTVSVVGFPANQSVSGQVGSSVVGHAPVVIVGGSILTSSTPNQSVSGQVGSSVIGTVPVTQSGTQTTSLVSTVPSSVIVGASIFGLAPVNVTNTNLNVSGSVVTFAQGNSSVISYIQNSVATVIIGGSIAATSIPPANQSVSGTVQTDVRNSVGAVIIGGSIATATTNSSVMILNGANAIGSVAVLQGTNPFIITGSVQGAFSPSGNQSVSGTVGASLVGTAPVTQAGTWTASVFGNMSVIGTVPVTQSTNPWIITGSVQGAFSPSGNQSVSGTVGASVIGHAPVVIVGGSILTSSTPNQSVSGRVETTQTGTVVTSLVSTVPSSVIVGASIFGLPPVNITNTNLNVGGSVVAFIQGNSSVISYVQNSVATVIIGGSIAASYTPPANQSVSGTVGARLESTNASVITVIQGSVAAQMTPAANQSVSGTVGASVVGHAPVVIVGGSILTSSTPNQSVSGTVGASVLGHAPVVIVGGSILTSSTPNQSVSGTVGTSIVGGLYRYNTGHVPSVHSGFPIMGVRNEDNVDFSGTDGQYIPVGVDAKGHLLFTPTEILNVAGSVVAFQGTSPWAVTGNNASVIVLVQGSVATTGTPAANQSVSGRVETTQTGTVITSLVSTIPSSVIVGASIFGLPPVNVTNTNLNVGGSVVAFQGAGWSGSVAAIQSGTRITSIVSTVPSSVIVGASIFGLPPVNVTNTNINVGGSVVAFQGAGWSGSVAAFQAGTQITSISGIPQASVHGAVTFLPSSIVSGHGSVNGAASVQILAAPGANLYNYVTDISLANTGSATTLVSITDGDGSVIGKLIAPTGGGAIMTAMSTPMKTMQTNKVVNISAATATSVLHAWIGGYKAP